MKQKNKKCKIVLIILFIIGLLIVYNLGYIYASYVDSTATFYFFGGDFYREDIYYSDLYYHVQYYHDNVGEEMIDDKDYLLVGDNDEKIKNYIKNTVDNINASGEQNVVFNYEIVTSNDYYLLSNYYDKKSLYYYDTDESVLYTMSVINDAKKNKE